ncbi:TPA: hypothetical protein ACX6RM_002265 [Photobacterium damselae]
MSDFLNITKNTSGYQIKIKKNNMEHQPHINGHSNKSLKSIIMMRNDAYNALGHVPKGILVNTFDLSAIDNTGLNANGVVNRFIVEEGGNGYDAYQISLRYLDNKNVTNKSFRHHHYRSLQEALKAAVAFRNIWVESYNLIANNYNEARLNNFKKLSEYEVDTLKPMLHKINQFDVELWGEVCTQNFGLLTNRLHAKRT